MLKKYIVERKIPASGYYSSEEFCHLVKNHNEEMKGPALQWVESFITKDKLICVFLAEDERLIWEHSRIGSIEINQVIEVKKSLHPSITTMADLPYIPGMM